MIKVIQNLLLNDDDFTVRSFGIIIMLLNSNIRNMYDVRTNIPTFDFCEIQFSACVI